MALERTYNVPLRKDFMRAPKYKRAKKAVNALREFLKRHMKSDIIKIGKFLNQKLWEHGIRNPPHHVKINVVKEDDGTVKAELFGVKFEEKKETKKEEKKQGEKKGEIKKEEAKAEKKEDKEISPPKETRKPKEIPKKEPTRKVAKVRENKR